MLTSTLANIAGALLPLIVQIVTVPIYLKLIGTERYGTLALVWLLLGYFGLFDLGFGRAIASRVAQLHDEDDRRSQIFWIGSALSLCTGIVGGLILYFVGGLLFKDVLHVSPDLIEETQGALPFIAMTLPMATLISALAGGLQGRQAFVILNVAQLSGMVLYQILPLVGAVIWYPTLPVLVSATIIGRLFSLIFLIVICRSEFSSKVMQRIPKSEIRSLFAYGGWATVTGAISPLLSVFDRFVIGASIGMTAVGIYSIPYAIITRLSVLPTSLQATLFPKYAMASDQESRSMMEVGIDLQSLIMAPIVATSIFFVQPLLQLWIGVEISISAVPVAQILLLGLWFNTLGYIPFSFLQSRGRPDLPAKFHLVELVVYAPVLFFMISWLGLVGAACAWTFRVVLDAVLLMIAVKPALRWRRLAICVAWISLSLAWAMWNGRAATVADYVLYAGCSLLCIVWVIRSLPAVIRQELMRRLRFRRA